MTASEMRQTLNRLRESLSKVDATTALFDKTLSRDPIKRFVFDALRAQISYCFNHLTVLDDGSYALPDSRESEISALNYQLSCFRNSHSTMIARIAATWPDSNVRDPKVLNHLCNAEWINAIKEYRNLTGDGLKDAKDAIEAIRYCNEDLIPSHRR